MKRITTALAVLGALLTLGFMGWGTAAHAATVPLPTVQFVMPVHNGLALDVWKRQAVVNAQLRLFTTSNTDPAEQFAQIATTYAGHPAGQFQIEYAPGGAGSGLCVSTISDSLGAFAALRPCAALAGVIGAVSNHWQDFTTTMSGDGASQIIASDAATPYALNDRQYGGLGSNVISWTVAPAASAPNNQLWFTV